VDRGQEPRDPEAGPAGRQDAAPPPTGTFGSLYEPPPTSWLRELGLFLGRLLVGVPVFAFVGLLLWGAFQWIVRPLYGKAVLAIDFQRERAIDDLREDLEFLQSTLEESHPGVYAHQTSEEMTAAFAAVEQRLHDGMSAADFLRQAAPLVAAIGCGHTALRPSMPTTRGAMAGGRFLPLGVRFSEERAYLVYHYADGIEIPRGAELLSMNGIPLEEVRRKLLESLPSDRRSPTYNRALAETQFAYWYWVFVDSAPSCRIRYRDPGDGDEREATVGAVPVRRFLRSYTRQHPELDPTRSPPRMRLAVLETQRLAYLRLYTFAPEHRPESAETLREFFSEVDHARVETLVVDVRGNAGGPPEVSVDLLRYLLAEPFPYLVEPGRAEHRALGYDRYYDAFEPHPKRFAGRLIVLLGPGSFSTTGHFLAHLAARGRAIFVGRESGGSALCYDGSQHLELPHTGLRLRVARLPFQAAGADAYVDRGVPPDYAVPPEIDDLVAGRDTLFDFLRETFGLDLSSLDGADPAGS